MLSHCRDGLNLLREWSNKWLRSDDSSGPGLDSNLAFLIGRARLYGARFTASYSYRGCRTHSHRLALCFVLSTMMDALDTEDAATTRSPDPLADLLFGKEWLRNGSSDATIRRSGALGYVRRCLPEFSQRYLQMLQVSVGSGCDSLLRLQWSGAMQQS